MHAALSGSGPPPPPLGHDPATIAALNQQLAVLSLQHQQQQHYAAGHAMSHAVPMPHLSLAMSQLMAMPHSLPAFAPGSPASARFDPAMLVSMPQSTGAL